MTNQDNVFTITRSGDTSDLSQAETVICRTVSLTAFAGQHFTAVNQQVAFAANETEKQVTVTERTPSNNAFKFQYGTSRQYRFEVTDLDGYRLAFKNRTITTGVNVSTSGIFNEKSVTIQSAEYYAEDKGYDKNGYKSVASSNYFNNAAPKEYFYAIGAELRMTLSFDAKEYDDGYQYLQLLVDNTSSCDAYDVSNGNPGTPNKSLYLAGFEIKHGSKYDTYQSYTFPVTSVGNGLGASNPWGIGTGFNLIKQNFNTLTTNYRASDGRLILPNNFSTLVLRLNASGSDNDKWYIKNVKAHIQAVDATAPTKLDISVAPGKHAPGNTVYVSVAFSEIVTPSSVKLNTTWGELTYISNSASNVLTFYGTIPDDAPDYLSITGFSGTINDLAGNSFSGSLNQSNLCALDANYDYPITYNLGGGTATNPATYQYVTPSFTLTAPTRTGGRKVVIP